MVFLRTVGLLMTYKCQIACPHCVVKAGPRRTEEIHIKDALNWITQISNYRNGYIKFLSLTGGEPFYNLNNLKLISKFAENLGLLVSAVTNAFWATSIAQAKNILKSLSALKMICLSTDIYHQKKIPLKYIENAVKAAKELNIPPIISICTENKDNEEYKSLVNKLICFIEPKDIQTVITFNAGRALKKNKTTYLYSKTPSQSACKGIDSPIIVPNGNVIACIGPVIALKNSHPLLLGNLKVQSVNEIFDKLEYNPIIHALRVWGPKKMISMLKDAGLNQYLPKNFIKGSICDTCYKIMSNVQLKEFFSSIIKNQEFMQKVSYARVYFLKEPNMINRFDV